MESSQEDNKTAITNESVMIDISLCSSSYDALSKTDLVDTSNTPNKKKRGCCYCCVILTISTVVSFVGLFLCHIIKKM
jgi:hypothetical protein